MNYPKRKERVGRIQRDWRGAGRAGPYKSDNS